MLSSLTDMGIILSARFLPMLAKKLLRAVAISLGEVNRDPSARILVMLVGNVDGGSVCFKALQNSLELPWLFFIRLA